MAQHLVFNTVYSGNNKYADDMAPVARQKQGSSDAQYSCHINTLVALFDTSLLKVSVISTKGMHCNTGYIGPSSRVQVTEP